MMYTRLTKKLQQTGKMINTLSVQSAGTKKSSIVSMVAAA